MTPMKISSEKDEDNKKQSILPLTRPQTKEISKDASFISGIFSCLMYTGCSIAMVLANKAIPMTVPASDRNNLPQTAIILSQCVIAVCLVETARYLRIVEYPGLSWDLIKQWLPLNILFMSMLFTGFLALVHLSVPMVTIFKNVTNLFTVFGDWYIFNEPASYLSILSVIIMTVGAILAGANDLEFDLRGYIWMILNCITTSSYVLYMRYASNNIKLSKFGMVYYNNMLSSIILLPIMILKGELSLLSNPIYYKPAFLVSNFLAGFLGFYLNFASLWCVSATSATTYAIVGSVNKVPITILGFIIFDTKMTYEGILFVTMATIGGLIYAYSKLPK